MKNGGPKSKKTIVYENLKKRIITNVLKPGEPLNEILLSKELKISKTPVREAIQQLEKEGLVENVQGKGSFISQFSLQDIRELFEMREMLECAVIRRVAQKADFDMNRAKLICDKFQSAEPEKSTTQKGFINAGDQIHTFFFEALGNKKLLEFYKGLQEQIIRMRHVLLNQVDEERSQASYKEHLETIEAVMEKDPDRAEKAMKNHLQNSVEYLKRVI
ncbi:MAG TPA: GntR family transcriptional regulator [Syntrophorhabdaceae bacterium]|nr:GntR family transcriptional regulator [Syntrophorhabdaceae bacterium]